ncbi:Hemicentin-1 [Bulinus truncatus]|nr:Hemicentin-1 [Bulinus truncatus]
MDGPPSMWCELTDLKDQGPSFVERLWTCTGRRRERSNPRCLNSYRSFCCGREDLQKKCLNGLCCVDGHWAPWEEWLCTENCSDTHMSRRRLCDNPLPAYGGLECHGVDLEFQPGECYKNNKTCPTDCAINTWYEGCTRTCISCEGDCNKFNGSCMTCMPGYRNPKRGCKQPCDSHSYGAGCSFSCKEKCGTICAEPVYGDCPDVSLLPLLLMLVFVVVPCSILICMPKSTGHRDVGSEYDPTATRTSRFISTTETFSSGSGSYSSSSSAGEMLGATARRGTRVEVAEGDVAEGGGREEENGVLMDEIQKSLFASMFASRGRRRSSVLQAQYHQYQHNRHFHIGHTHRHHKHRRKDEGSTVDPSEDREGSLKSALESIVDNN